MLKETFGSLKPVIAMVHFPPLPGAPGYDGGRGMAAIVDAAARDIERLQEGGIDAVMFDGCIVGTHFKIDGDTWNPVDRDRVKRFMDVVGKLR